jgi:tetratricopeptide (TPR) repeat protein
MYSIEYAVILAKYYNEVNKAMKYFERAVRKGRHNVINQAIIFADTLHEKQESTRAIKCYQILLELCKKDYRIFKGLKNIFSSMKRFDQAAKTISTYIKNNPNSIEAYVDLADLCYLKQNYNKAFDYFVLANNMNLNISENKFNYIKKKIGLCSIHLKLHETAFKYFENYIKMKTEENIYLLMAFLKVLYFDNLEDADFLLKVSFKIISPNIERT